MRESRPGSRKADSGVGKSVFRRTLFGMACVPGGGLTRSEAGSNITALCGEKFSSRELHVREESIKKERQPDV